LIKMSWYHDLKLKSLLSKSSKSARWISVTPRLFPCSMLEQEAVISP